MRAKAVADGQLVEIPALRLIRTVGTQEDNQTGEWKNPGKREGIYGRQIRRRLKLKRDAERR